MAHQPYPHAPITEAVIEIRFAEAIDDTRLQGLSARFEDTYPHEQVLSTIESANFLLNVLPERANLNTIVNVIANRRRSTFDQQELLTLNGKAFVVAQLAPYPGWDALLGRFARDWKRWRRQVEYRKIQRIGVRFINRIDVPAAEKIDLSHYVQLCMNLPEDFGVSTGYTANVVVELEKLKAKLVVNTGVVFPPPVPRHYSIVLDFDIGREDNCPQSDEQVMDYLHSVRAEKNRVFEASITDKARELFQ